MGNKARGEHLRRQILSNLEQHPNDISRYIADLFSISLQAVNLHIQRLEAEGRLTSKGRGKGKRYFLGELRERAALFPLTDGFAEDSVWREEFAFIFKGLAENVVDICHYGFTEMVNNVIDHSAGENIHISVQRRATRVVILITDDGEGIFRRIKRLCKLEDERQALFELAKGKLTTDPENHTGEGIFFTSRAFDEFEIDSKGLKFSHADSHDYDWLIESEISKDEAGTIVYMMINTDSQRDLQNVFAEFTAGPTEYQFNKTVVPVRLAQYENEKLVSRSQAKRLLNRIEKFQNVILDFEGISAIGQAFADEIFRVYANRHPDIVLLPINMQPDVTMMVNRARHNKD